MPRTVYLVGVSLAAAATTTLNCTASGSVVSAQQNCQSCVTTGTASVCSATYLAAALPTCGATCNNLCSSTPSASTTVCNVCVIGATAGVGVCLATTQNVGFALSSQSTLDLGIDTSVFGSSNTVAATIDASANGTVTAANSVVTVSTATVANLSVGASTAASVAIFEVNGGGAAAAAVTVNQWNNNAGTAKVDNSASLVVGQLTTGSSFFSVWQNSSASVVTFNSIDFSSRQGYGTNGIVHVSGGQAVVNASIKGTGVLQLSGGVSASSSGGSLPQTLTVNVKAQGTSGPVAAVDTSKNLELSGDITGDSGVLSVSGKLTLGTTSVNVAPQVVVNNAGTLVVNSATSFHAKAVSISQSATLQLGASTQAAAQQGKVVIDQISQCLGTVQINLATTASVFASGAMAGSAIAFNYSATNNVANLASCAVQVVDSTGATFTLQSSTSASAGRRLLASSGTATWGNSGMSYQMTGQSNGAVSSFAVLPMVAIGLLGFLM